MAWVANLETHELKKHDVNNVFTLDLPADCFESVDPDTIIFAPGEFDSAKALAISSVSALALGYMTL